MKTVLELPEPHINLKWHWLIVKKRFADLPHGDMAHKIVLCNVHCWSICLS